MPINKNSLDQIPHGYIALDPEKYPAINNRGNLTTKQLALLAAAEESFSQSAVLLFHPLKGLLKDVTGWQQEKQLKNGLKLMEEAMARHNAYMELLE